MTALERLIPGPHLTETDYIDVTAPAADVWHRVRHGELAHSFPVRALFRLRTVVSRQAGEDSPTIRIESLRSSPGRPGFQVLVDEPPFEVAVGAIGKVWQLDIPFVHVEDARAFAAFAEPDYIKVAWAIRVQPRDAQTSHVELEVRVTPTDVAAWRKFRRYFRVIGPFSRFIRRSLLRAIARDAPGRDHAESRAA
jgi:hypothetical protein